MTKYFCSRQSYWPAGENVVEIAAGGLEYSNPDMLSDLPDHTYGKLGDMLETMDPREALEAAIAIRDEWNRRGGNARIEVGFTHGCTIPFEEHPTDKQLQEWAEAAWAETPKCAKCGDPLPGEDWYYIPEIGVEDLWFCSEYCADEYFFREYLDSVAEKEVHLL